MRCLIKQTWVGDAGMRPSLISCIIPVFNGESYLAEALESVLAQTYQPVEIVVVDDGSTDGTAEVAAHYGERVHYVWQSNAGQTAARNLGLSAAQGEFVAFLDADDMWHPEKIEQQIDRLRERPEIDLCFTRFQHFWMPELAEEEKRYQGHPLSQPLSAYLISTLLVRRRVFEKFGAFMDDGSGRPVNLIWFFHAAEHGAIIDVLPNVLTYRRLHGDNQSRRGRADFFEMFFPILKVWRDHQRRRLDR
jgi:glycosyltransferase involved in cell wall biosynthesis